jgi:hypothetical protein
MQICKKDMDMVSSFDFELWTLLPHVPSWIFFKSKMYLGDLWCISTFLVIQSNSYLVCFYKCYFFVLSLIELWIILHCDVGMWWPLGLEVSFAPLIFLGACNILGSLTRIFLYMFLMLFCDICTYTHYCLVYFVILIF